MFLEPIALLTYKRPELTKNIINIILSLKPRKFYIIQDGPKKDFSQKDKRLFDKNQKIILSLKNRKNISFIFSFSSSILTKLSYIEYISCK